MSCFIMDYKAVAVLADGVEKALNLGYGFLGLDAPETLREALKDCADRYGYFDRGRIFANLCGLNYWAYAERYNGRHLEGTEEAPEMPEAPALINRVGYADGHYTLTPEHYRWAKLLECYLYQCDEGSAAKTQLYKGLEALQRRWLAFLVYNHDDWAAAPWGEL